MPSVPRLDRRVAALCGAVLALGAPAVTPLVAQSPVTLDLFAARKEASTSPLFGGASLTTYKGPLGLRFGGGLNVGNGDGATVRTVPTNQEFCRRGRPCGRVQYVDQGSLGPSINAWSADADLLFEPFRAAAPLRALLLGFSPYAFAGIGQYETGVNSAGDSSLTTWSYGGGLHHTLIGAASLGAEARYRQPIHSSVAPSEVTRQSWEYRVALSFGLGGHHRSTSAALADRGCDAASCAPQREPEVAVTDANAYDSRLAARVLDAADGYVDAPYRFGGTGPSGFDAAGFVQYVYGKEGVRLPRTARDMATAGTEISTRVGSLKPGDLLFFANDGSHVDHVAIYVGHERIIHASASGDGVRYDDLADGARGQWFADHLVAARRVTGLRRDRAAVDPSDDELDRPDRAPRAGRSPR